MDSLREHPQGSSHIPSRPVASHNICQAEEWGSVSGIQDSIVHQEGNHVLVQPGNHDCIHKQPKGNKECRSDGNNEKTKKILPSLKVIHIKGRAKPKGRLAPQMQSQLLSVMPAPGSLHSDLADFRSPFS